jgi:predicted secreted protein
LVDPFLSDLKSKGVIALLLSLVLSMGCYYRGLTNESEKTMEENHKMYVGDTLLIEMESNPSSGFVWVWKNADSVNIVESVDWSFSSDTGLTGGSGMENWHFLGLEAGEDQLIFEYRQPWDQETPPEDVKTINILVEKRENE